MVAGPAALRGLQIPHGFQQCIIITSEHQVVTVLQAQHQCLCSAFLHMWMPH